MLALSLFMALHGHDTRSASLLIPEPLEASCDASSCFLPAPRSPAPHPGRPIHGGHEWLGEPRVPTRLGQT